LGLTHESCTVVATVKEAPGVKNHVAFDLQATGEGIAYSIPAGGSRVKILAYDLSGRLIRALDCGWKGEGRHELRLGRDFGLKTGSLRTLMVRLVSGSKDAATVAVLSK
jgi:hypothetical protein